MSDERPGRTVGYTAEGHPIRQARADELEDDGWTAQKPITGLALADAKPGEPVDVATAGTLRLPYSGDQPSSGHNIRTITTCAKALGIEPPGGFGFFLFSEGQVFYRDQRLEEVRLAGAFPVTPVADAAPDPDNPDRRTVRVDKDSHELIWWTTPVPPSLTLDETGERLVLAPEDEGRTHLSAKAVPGDGEGAVDVLFFWDLTANNPRSDLVPAGAEPAEPSKGLCPLSFGMTRADARAVDLVHNLHQLRLPRKWANVPRWEELVAKEVQTLQEDYGEVAFAEDHVRDALLARRTGRDGREVVQLTPESKRALRVRVGTGVGYRDVDARTGAEYLVRLVQTGTGYLEVGLSWWGQAGPLVESWLEDARRAAKQAQRDAAQLVLFDDLSRDRQLRLDAMLTRVRCWDYGRKVLALVLGQVGRQAQNPVEVPAETMRLLLGLEADPDWKAAVDGALIGLQHLESRLRSFDLGREVYGYGTALAGWTYVGRGPGGHGGGAYYLEVGQQFLGCLRVFESGRRKLRGKLEATTFDWGRQLPKERRAELGWTPQSKAAGTEPERYHAFDAGAVFYNAAEGLTPQQEALVAFLEAQETLRRDTAARDPETGRPWTRKAGPDAEDAREPRVYDRTFCPVLPEGQRYHGALGHFTKNAEAGRTLGGTPRRAGKTGGAHHAGLLDTMGYLLEPGRATVQRRQVVEAALQDLRAVVMDYLGGVVAARGPDGSWLTAEEAQQLPWDQLVQQTRWFLFLPETWREDRKRRWEERTGYRATEDEAEARHERAARWSGEEPEEDLPSPVGARVGTGGLPLFMRLHMAMKERGLSQGAVAQLFGVDQSAVSRWFKGTDPDPETGEVKGKPIPAELRPLAERWVAGGEPPTADELAARKTRRTGRREG